MGFPRQEYWSGLPFPSPGDLPNPGIERASPALAGWFFISELPGKLCSSLLNKVSAWFWKIPTWWKDWGIWSQNIYHRGCQEATPKPAFLSSSPHWHCSDKSYQWCPCCKINEILSVPYLTCWPFSFLKTVFSLPEWLIINSDQIPSLLLINCET